MPSLLAQCPILPSKFQENRLSSSLRNPANRQTAMKTWRRSELQSWLRWSSQNIVYEGARSCAAKPTELYFEFRCRSQSLNRFQSGRFRKKRRTRHVQYFYWIKSCSRRKTRSLCPSVNITASIKSWNELLQNINPLWCCQTLWNYRI